jgi:hypothetical protein
MASIEDIAAEVEKPQSNEKWTCVDVEEFDAVLVLLHSLTKA